MSKLVSLPNDNVCVLGRADIREDGIAFDWTNSGVLFRFRGTKAKFRFDVPALNQRLFLHIIVDGQWTRACVCEGSTEIEAVALQEGEHKVHCVRITEVLDAVPLVIRDITLEGEDPVLLSKPILPERRIEFIGDSITCGFGLLTDGLGQGYKTDEQDGAHTYAAQTAAYLMSQANFICISGRGVVRNCDDIEAPLIPEFFKWTTVSNPTPWDYSQYQPDVVVVNAGTNDADGDNPTSKEKFKAGVLDFLKELRRVYPNAHIVWVYGMMNTLMDDVLTEALKEFGDEKAIYVPMETAFDRSSELGACYHPNQRAHRRCAGVLIDVISDLTGWQR